MSTPGKLCNSLNVLNKPSPCRLMYLKLFGYHFLISRLILGNFSEIISDASSPLHGFDTNSNAPDYQMSKGSACIQVATHLDAHLPMCICLTDDL